MDVQDKLQSLENHLVSTGIATMAYIPHEYRSEELLQDMDLTVLHYVSGIYSNMEDPFSMSGIRKLFIELCKPGPERSGVLDPITDKDNPAYPPLPANAHLLVGRDGKCWVLVPLHCKAWHAGVSSWNGRNNCNDYSIGIELVGKKDLPFTDIQYDVLSSIGRSIRHFFPSMEFTGHENIAPGRKIDPGPLFQWDTFRTMVFNKDIPPVSSDLAGLSNAGPNDKLPPKCRMY